MKIKHIKYQNGLSVIFKYSEDGETVDYTLSRLIDDELIQDSNDVYDVDGLVLKPTVFVSGGGGELAADKFKYVTDINDDLVVLSNEIIGSNSVLMTKLDLKEFLMG